MTCTSIKHFLSSFREGWLWDNFYTANKEDSKSKALKKECNVVCLKIASEISHGFSDVLEYLRCFAENDTTAFHCQASHLHFGLLWKYDTYLRLRFMKECSTHLSYRHSAVLLTCLMCMWKLLITKTHFTAGTGVGKGNYLWVFHYALNTVEIWEIAHRFIGVIQHSLNCLK